MAARPERPVLRVVVFALMLSGAALAGYRLGLHRLLADREALAHWLASFDSATGVLVFMALQVLQVLFAPIPGEVTGFVGGFLYGGLRGLLFSTIGLTAGSLAAFGLGRFFGRPLVQRLAKPETLERYDFLMEHRGLWISLLLFLIPGFPKDLLCYVLGTSRMPCSAFFAVSTVGRLLGTAMLSLSGHLARGGAYRLLGVVAVAAALVALLSYLYRDRWLARFRSRRRREKKDASF